MSSIPTNMIWKKVKGEWTIGKFMGVDWSGVEWDYEGKQPCPHCQAQGDDNSGNNLHVYGLDELGRPLGGKCFREELVIVSVEKAIDDANEENGNAAKDKVKSFSGGKKTDMSAFDEKKLSKEKAKLKRERLSGEELQEILDSTGDNPKMLRGLDHETSQKYEIRYQYDESTGKAKVMMIPAFIEEDGKFVITGYKCRNFKRKKEQEGHFYSVGYVGKLNCFMGQNIAKSANHALIVGGEIDVIAADALLKKHSKLKQYNKNYVVLSSLVGEPATFEVCKQNYEFMDKFSKVVIALDNDDAGKDAAERVKEVLPNETLFIAKMSYKDPWVYWEEFKRHKNKEVPKEFENDIHWNSQVVKSFGLVGSRSLLSRAIEHVIRPKIPLPAFLQDLDDYFTDGIDLGEIFNIISNTSTGKSVYVNEMISDWVVNAPYKMCIFSLEDNCGSYGTKIASRLIGRSIHRVKGAENRKKILEDNEDKIMEFLTDKETGEDAFYLIEEAFSDLEQVKKAILQAIKVLGCKIIVIDPLVNLISHKSNEEQISFMVFEEECRRIYDVTFINVCHTRKVGGGGSKAASQGGDITEEDVKGTSQITGSATINMIIRRDKGNACEIKRNTTEIDLVKNRGNGQTGKAVAKIFYHGETHTLIPYSIAEENDFYQDGQKVDFKRKGITPVTTQEDAEDDDEVVDPDKMDFTD
ncbi:primase/helicase protein [Acinetobacter phage vB_AbaM_D22]|nr:primase/helicase protein [Acinetobacter phage vB_AbaM_D22]